MRIQASAKSFMHLTKNQWEESSAKQIQSQRRIFIKHLSIARKSAFLRAGFRFFRCRREHSKYPLMRFLSFTGSSNFRLSSTREIARKICFPNVKQNISILSKSSSIERSTMSSDLSASLEIK